MAYIPILSMKSLLQKAMYKYSSLCIAICSYVQQLVPIRFDYIYRLYWVLLSLCTYIRSLNRE